MPCPTASPQKRCKSRNPTNRSDTGLHDLHIAISDVLHSAHGTKRALFTHYGMQYYLRIPSESVFFNVLSIQQVAMTVLLRHH